MISRLFFFTLLFFSSSLQAATTFETLASYCKTAIQIQEAADNADIRKDLHAAIQSAKCWTYLESFQEALAWSAIKQAERNPDSSFQDVLKYLPFCLPQNVTSKQQALMIINHALRNPAHANLPAGAVFGEIMLNQYPCKSGR